MSHTIIIAEAGVNHNGSIDQALRLIDAAADAGVDYVKFQTFKSENLVAASARMADYQCHNMHTRDNGQLKMLKALELPYASHRRLIDHCRERGVKFCSTPFDLESIRFLHSLNLDFWKVPSGEITNFPYLRAIAQAGGKVVMSTGMSTPTDIAAALDVLCGYGIHRRDITLLHCNTQYPTPMRDVNLAAMDTMRTIFNLPVGYSDHTRGIEVPIAAVALGACVIEKHFTLDRSLPGPDHKASIEPAELKLMVSSIRNVEEAIGASAKDVSPSEKCNMDVARKSIVAATHIAKGDKLTDANLTAKRPGSGISPMMWLQVVGTTAIKDFVPDEMIVLG